MLYYVAHPVAGDGIMTFEENKEHTLDCLKALYDKQWPIICPWWTDLHYLDDSNQSHRETAMERQLELLRLIGGNIILTGHKISAGMQLEMVTAMGMGGHVVDLTTFDPSSYPTFTYFI